MCVQNAIVNAYLYLLFHPHVVVAHYATDVYTTYACDEELCGHDGQ